MPAIRTGRLIPLLGVAAALIYGVAIERMRLSPPLVMVGLGGLVIALCAMALWQIVDPLLRPAAAAGTGASGDAAAPEAAPGRTRELEREKQAVLKAIKEIELDYQMLKIADDDYRELTERYRTRAMRLLAELDAGDDYRPLIERELKDRLAAMEAGGGGSAAAPAAAREETAQPAPAAARRCVACGAANDADAVFCKRCGAKL